MTRSAICIAFGASLLALFWLALPAAAQTTECNDTIDNDGDGRVDFPADLGCASAEGLYEGPDCDDGIDNDEDGLTDLDDLGCRNRQLNSLEDPQCNDKDGFGLALDNGDGDSVANVLDPQCYYQDEFLPWWNDESRKRAGPAPIPGGWEWAVEDGACGVAEYGDVALLLPFLWLWRRGRRSRKA